MPLRKKTDAAKKNGGESPRLDEKTTDRNFPGQASEIPEQESRTPPGVPAVKDEATGESRAPDSRGYEELGGGYGSYQPNRGARDFSRWPSNRRPSSER